MTTAAPSAAPQTRLRYLSLAVGASLVQMAMMIPGYSDAGSFQTMEWLTALAISLVVGLLVFALAVPHGGPRTGIVLGALAVVTILVFWAGVTLPLAAAAIVVGWHLRQSGEHRMPAIVTLALGALGVVALVVIIIGDAIAN